MFLSARHSTAAALGFWLWTLTGCLPGQPPGFDGGLCTWNFPADDPCASSGLVCRQTAIEDPTTICQLPGELFRCSPRYGCNASHLSCREVPVPGLGTVPLCLRSCATVGSSSDCPNPFSFCQQLPDGEGNACQLASCLGAFQLASCQVGDSAPGTCLPLSLGGTPLAFCHASGSSQPGASCSLGGSYLPVCVQGAVCISQQCFQVCNRTAGPACPGGTICSPPYLVNESAAFFDGNTSFCLTPCSGGIGCTPPLSCYEPPGQQGLCLP